MAKDTDRISQYSQKGTEEIVLVQLEDMNERQSMTSRMSSNARHVLLYEDPDTQAKAREVIPIQELEAEAREAAGPEASAALVRDKLHAALLAWFKHKFFKWVSALPAYF